MNTRIAAAASALLLVGAAAGAVPVFSAQERADGLRQGLGMGLAKPADNNGYPGPKHVLDAADRLGLTPDQRNRTAEVFARMQAEAIPAADRLLADEQALEALFVDKRANLGNVTAAAETAARSLAAVQIIHLKYHLAMRSILTPDQIAAYAAPAVESQSVREPGGHDAAATDHHHD